MKQRISFEQFATWNESISHCLSLAIPHVLISWIIEVGTKRRYAIYMTKLVLMRSEFEAMVVDEWISLCLVYVSLESTISFLRSE